MPQLGETVAEGKIVKWFKSAGDAVKPGDNLFEIETDKTSMEVPATFAGTLAAINFQVGEVAKVGAVVAVIAGEGGAAAQPKTAEAPKAAPQAPLTPAKAGVQSPAVQSQKELDSRLRGNDRGKSFAYHNMDPFREVRTPERNYGPARVGGVTVTPLARRLAGEHGIDLATISGSGPHGRIVAADIAQARPPPAPQRRRSRRCSRASPTTKYRSTACARPSRGGWSRPNRPCRISISSATSRSAG